MFAKPSLAKTVLFCVEVAPVMNFRTVSSEEDVVRFTTLLRDLCSVSAFALSTGISLSSVEIYLV